MEFGEGFDFLLETGCAFGGDVEVCVRGAEVGFEDCDALVEGFGVVWGFGGGVFGAEGHGDLEGVEFLFCSVDLVFCCGGSLFKLFDCGFSFGDGAGEAVDLVPEVAHLQFLGFDCGCRLRQLFADFGIGTRLPPFLAFRSLLCLRELSLYRCQLCARILGFLGFAPEFCHIAGALSQALKLLICLSQPCRDILLRALVVLVLLLQLFDARSLLAV